MVSRPANTVFRIADEVFLCSRNRPDALGKRLLFLGVLDNNRAHPNYSAALLLDEQAFELEKTLNSGSPSNSDFSINVFRVCPIQFVAQIPNDRHLDETTKLIVDEAGAFSDPYFFNFSTKHREIHELDYVQPKKPPRGLKKSVQILSKKIMKTYYHLRTKKL